MKKRRSFGLRFRIIWLLRLFGSVILAADCTLQRRMHLLASPCISAAVELPVSVIPQECRDAVIVAHLHQLLAEENAAVEVVSAGGIFTHDDGNALIGEVRFHHSYEVFHFLLLGFRSPFVLYIGGAEIPGSIVVDGNDTAPCRVIRHLIERVAGFIDICPVACDEQVARRVLSSGGTYQVNKRLVEPVQRFVRFRD